MRIANSTAVSKHALLGVGTAVFFALCSAGLSEKAHAVEAAQAAVPPVSAAGVSVLGAGSDVSGGVVASKGTEDNSIEKSVSKIEEKVIDSGKDAVKRLDSATDDTTLTELNHARQVVTRIEAMIDVEKRLSELDRVRNDRRGNDARGALPGSLAAAIPASALAPMRGGGSAVGANGELGAGDQGFVVPGSGHPKIVRIVGSGGKYSAVIKSGGGLRTVRVGDKISAGAYVRSISTTSVEVGGKGTSYTLHVKNGDVVQGVVR